MSSPPEPEERPRRRTSNHAAAAEARDILVRQQLEKERAALDAKTIKLKALRLAKEEEKRQETVQRAEAFRVAMQRKAQAAPQKPAENKVGVSAKKTAKPSRSAVNQKRSSAPAKPKR